MKKQQINWTKIGRDYRTSDKSVRTIAHQHSVSEGAIRKRAKAAGWTRPERAPKAPAKRKRLSVTYEVSETTVTPEAVSPEALIGRSHDLALRMLDELNAATSHVGALEGFIIEATEGESQRRVEAMMKSISLSERANTLRTLAVALKTLAETKDAGTGGKKEQRKAAAEKVGGGSRFAPRPGPRLAVINS